MFTQYVGDAVLMTVLAMAASICVWIIVLPPKAMPKRAKGSCFAMFYECGQCHSIHPWCHDGECVRSVSFTERELQREYGEMYMLVPWSERLECIRPSHFGDWEEKAL